MIHLMLLVQDLVLKFIKESINLIINKLLLKSFNWLKFKIKFKNIYLTIKSML